MVSNKNVATLTFDCFTGVLVTMAVTQLLDKLCSHLLVSITVIPEIMYCQSYSDFKVYALILLTVVIQQIAHPVQRRCGDL